MMKLLAFISVCVGLVLNGFADEHDFYPTKSDDGLNIWNGSSWTNTYVAAASKAQAGNRYWINTTVGLHDGGTFAGDLLAFGTPTSEADSPVPVGAATIRLRKSKTFTIADLALYQGEFRSANNYNGVIKGDATVYTSGLMKFRVYQNGSTCKGEKRSIDLGFALHGAADTSLVLEAGTYPTDPTFLYLSGDFSDYHGTWTAKGKRLYFNTSTVMGCEADGAKNDVFTFNAGTELLIANDKAPAISRTRGVTLNKNVTLTLATTNEPYACDDYVVNFPITRGGSSSVLAKANDGRVTLDGPCSVINVQVNGGTLALGTNFASKTSLQDFTVVAGAKLEIPEGVRAVAGSVVYDGTALATGYYSGSAISGCQTSPAITGDGILFVVGETPAETTTATWNHEGTGGVLTDGANWAEETKPTLTDGSADLTFAQAGTEAVVSSWATAHGITLDAPGDFMLKGSYGLALLGGGLTLTPDDAAQHRYVFEAPVYVQASQTWALPSAATANDTLVFKSALCGDASAATLTKTGATPVFLEGTNAYRGVLDFQNGRLTVSGTLGVDPATDGALKGNGDTGSRFTFTNAVINKVFDVSNCKQDDLYVFPAGTTNVFRGKITHSGSATFWIYNGAVVSIEGGYDGSSKFWQRGSDNGWIYVRKTPISIGMTASSYLAPFDGHMIWQVADNEVNYVGFNYDNVNWRTDVDYALNGKTGVVKLWNTKVYSGRSTIDLTSTRQCIQNFTPTGGIVRITGEAGSCLELAPTVAEQALDLKWAEFTGAVSLQKHGANMLVLSNGVAATTGDLIVTNGVLALDVSASWPNGTNFTASCEGTLRFAAKGQITGKSAVLHLSENGKISIPAGVKMRFAAVTLNGASVATGIYSAGEEGIAAHIEGDGTLQVGKYGLSVFVW